ncbi:carboxypeptidase-like regulatory domain-containing protein [Mesonia sp. HuA40]|uniref:TonB-dependent receptor n=1 Tax=Mesonia sp. HuA40 TaxID=2602761 RepID=UPI00164FDA91|nr:carboxypeptidase-like regulatory domain-containing protein [Mesonia sp. HuA40]
MLALLLLCSCKVFAQSEKRITGKLTDESNEVVAGASVLLKSQSGEILTYAISDENGDFVLTAEAEGIHRLEVSHIAYALYTEALELIKYKQTYSKDIVLKPNGNELEEVVIQGRRAVATQNGDTLSYNLGAYTTGNEQKLKDIIEKLPGLEIDESGKIKSEGKVIDNLLVDGKPFFGDNHKIATDNLNAKMVGGIDVLKNYETFDAVKDIEGSNETAINIQIKEEYQGKPTGNIEAYGAYENRYRLHANLFSFGKKHNLSFIGDINNTGQQPISLLDYIQMDESDAIKSKEDELSSINTNSDLPSFLQENNNRVKQQSKFGALNAVFAPSHNTAIEAFSILNKEKIKQKQFTEQSFFSQSQSITSEEFIQVDKDFLINQTYIKAEYKPSANSILKYTLDYKPQHNEFVTSIDGEVQETEQNTLQNIENRGHTLGQNIAYTSRLASDKLLSVNAFSSFKRNKTQIGLVSNQSLFNLGNNIAQELENNNDEYGVYSKYTQRINNHILKFNLGYVWQKSDFYDTALPDENSSLINQDYLYSGASIEKKEGFFQYKARVNLRRYSNSFNARNDDNWLFLPTLESKLSFSETHYLSFNYNRQAGFPDASQLNLFPFVRDYRNYRTQTTADFSEPIINNRFGMQYFYFNLYSGTQILFNAFYNKTKNDIGVNNEVVGIYNYSNFLNVPYKSNWTNTLRFQTRINPIKTTFKLNLDYSNIEFNNFLNGIQNKATNQQYKIKPALASYFKDAWINYEIGIDYEQNNTFFDLTDLENKGSKTSPFLTLEGEFSSDWSYSVNNAIAYFRTSTIKRNFHQLDFELRYNKASSKFSYWLSGENILNIESAQIVEAIAMQNSISRTIIDQMPGYIGAGVSYDF